MNIRSFLLSFAVLTAAESASAQIAPQNNFSLGGFTNGTVSALPYPARMTDPIYREILSAVKKSKTDSLKAVLSNYSKTPGMLDNRLNYFAVPPLYYAIEDGKPEHTAILIQYGAIVDFNLSAGDFKDFQKEVQKKIDIRQTITGTCSPLAYACMVPALSASQRRASLAVIKALLDAGADCNLPGFEDKPPAMLLAERDMNDALKLLLSYDRVKFESPVLMTYMETHRDDTPVKMLYDYKEKSEQARLKKAADAEKQAKKPAFSGQPSISFEKAVRTDNTAELTKHLGVFETIDAPLPGADNPYKQTPLIRAVLLNKPEAVRIILAAGADPNLADGASCPPLVYAKMKKFDAVSAILEEAGAKMPVCETIEEAAKQDRPDEIERLFKAAEARKIKTGPILAQALMTAVGLEREQAFGKLVSLGANPNQIRVNRLTPLIFHLGDKGLANFILACKNSSTNLDLTVKHPVSKLPPLLHAIQGKKPNQAAVIQALVKVGANPNLRGAKGKTPLMFAAESGRTELVDALLEAGANPNLTDAAKATYKDYIKKAKTN